MCFRYDAVHQSLGIQLHQPILPGRNCALRSSCLADHFFYRHRLQQFILGRRPSLYARYDRAPPPVRLRHLPSRLLGVSHSAPGRGRSLDDVTRLYSTPQRRRDLLTASRIPVPRMSLAARLLRPRFVEVFSAKSGGTRCWLPNAQCLAPLMYRVCTNAPPKRDGLKRFDTHRPIQSAKHDRDQPLLPLGDRLIRDPALGIRDASHLAKDFASDPLTDAAGGRLISVKKAVAIGIVHRRG